MSEREIIFEKYEKGRFLGSGGFAKVYFGREISSGRSVAIKVINKRIMAKKSLIAMVKNEISIMGKLHHPNVIRIIDALASKSKVYIVMEYAKGGELFAKLNKSRFTEELSRKYFRQLISAVGYFHSLGVYHRDLKPENLLLDEKMNLKVADFGLSTYKPNDDMLDTKRGTPSYVAPDVLTTKLYHGGKVDVWSCGVILYVLTAGCLPFQHPNDMVLFRKICSGVYKCPKWMSGDLKYLLSRLLDVNPKKRITIEEIIDNAWFKKGCEEETFRFNDVDYIKKEEVQENEDVGIRFFDAFDFICVSPEFNLKAMFREDIKGENCCETFLSREKAEKVVETVEKAAREVGGAGVVVKRVKWGMGVQIEGQYGKFGLNVLVHMLTEELVIVEVKKRENNFWPCHAFWKDKLKPKVYHLIDDSNKTR